MPVIQTDGGRLIDYPEGELKKPFVPKVITYVPKTYKRTTRVKDPVKSEAYKGDNHHLRRLLQTIPGYVEWVQLRGSVLEVLAEPHIPCEFYQGRYTKEQTKRKWRKAERLADKDMEILKEKINLTEAAEEALRQTLVLMRGPQDAKTKLQARPAGPRFHDG